MFDEILGKLDVERTIFKNELKDKFDFFYHDETVRARKIRFRDSMFFFDQYHHTGGPPFKQFVLDELRDIFESTGRSKIVLTELEYEEGKLTIEDIAWIH